MICSVQLTYTLKLKYLSLSVGAEAVPHGIDLLTTCDYHSVGIRAHAYTELSVKVAEKSDEYANQLVGHLIEKKISHWDNSVRELTGQALR